MDGEPILQHRYGSVAIELARRLLTLREGDRIEAVGRLANEFETGRGTIQSALKLLTEEGALQIESLGKRGSFIKSMDRSMLLEIAELTAIIGTMPVAYSAHFQGLATGLNQTFLPSGIPLLLAQLRGSKNRLHFLRSGRCDFAIISKLTWQEVQHEDEYHLLLSFGPGTNLGDHVLLTADHNVERIIDGMRVGIDSSSYDHYRLTMEEFKGHSVQFVEMSYGQSLQKLLAGDIDATVWDAGLNRPPSSLKMRPLSNRTKATGTNTEAVLIVRKDCGALQDLILQLIDTQLVIEMQRQVIERKITPMF